MQIKRHTAAWLLGLALAVSGLACTSTQKVDTSAAEPGSEPGSEPGEEVGEQATPHEGCFNVLDVESFSPLHGRFVYVRLIHQTHYLLTLDNIYTSLPYARGVAISHGYTHVCSTTGATLSFTDAGRQVNCRIVKVEAVDSRKQAQEIVEDRTTPGRL